MFVAVYDTCVGVIPTDASLEQKASGGRITTHTLRVVQSESVDSLAVFARSSVYANHHSMRHSKHEFEQGV